MMGYLEDEFQDELPFYHCICLILTQSGLSRLTIDARKTRPYNAARSAAARLRFAAGLRDDFKCTQRNAQLQSSSGSTSHRPMPISRHSRLKRWRSATGETYCGVLSRLALLSRSPARKA